MKDLAGKSAFVTGAAGGIGLGIARAFARQGMSLALADIEAGALEDARQALSGEGVAVRSFNCDVSERSSIEGAMRAAEDRLGNLHVLCNCAGVAVAGRFQSISQEDWQWVLGVNLIGVVNGVAAFLPQARAHGEGAHIVNVGALSALWSIPLCSAYNASKGAILSLSDSLARELEPEGIGVSVVLPAAVPSRLEESERNRPARFGPPGGSAENQEFMAARRNRPAPSALDAITVGRRVVEAIQGAELYVFTHRDWRARIEDKLGTLAEALDAADASPALAGTDGRGVTDFKGDEK